MNKKRGEGEKSGTIKGRGVVCIICGTQLRQPIFHVITAIPAIRLSNSRDKIRFGCFTINPLRNRQSPPHPTAETNDYFPMAKNPIPNPSPRLIIGQISISGRHLFPIPESGRPMEPVRPVPLAFAQAR